MTGWLGWTRHVDLTSSRGNGPFAAGSFRGVVLHVNVDQAGTSDSFFAAGPSVNPDSVTPTFQVYGNGDTHQYLPLDWQPWCQADGNYQYGAIETAGMPDEPLTAAQQHSIARILAAYHEQMRMPLQEANRPGEFGFGWHGMGGDAWGGHPLCPGVIRKNQRAAILEQARGGSTPTDPFTQTMEQIMAWYKTQADFEAAIAQIVRQNVMKAEVPLRADGAKPTTLGHLLDVDHATIHALGEQAKS